MNIQILTKDERRDELPGKDERIAAAVEDVINGVGDEKAKGIEHLGFLRARLDLVREACISKSSKVRAAGALALGRVGENSDRLTLEQLASDENSYVRTAACQGLGLGNFLNSYLLLIDIAQDAAEHVVVRANAIIAAARLAAVQSERAERAVLPITPSDLQIMEIAENLYADQALRFDSYARVLGALGCQPALEKLESLADAALHTGLPDPRNANLLLQALSRKPLTERGCAIMAKALLCLPGGRMQAARALAENPNKLARKSLECSLHDASPERLRLLLVALRAIGIAASLDELRKLLRRDDKNALMMINHLKGPDTFDFCLEIATSGQVGQRAAAVQQLWYLDAGRAIAALEGFASDSNPQIRYAALQLLICRSEQPALWREKAKDDVAPWVAQLANPQVEPSECQADDGTSLEVH